MFSAKEAVELGEVIFMAVHYTTINDTIQSPGAANFKGKVVVDVTNPLTGQLDLDAGFKTSKPEQLAKIIPDSKVVKAFNYAFANNMSTGRIKGERMTLFVAGDYQDAKDIVMKIGSDIFFDPVDSGPLLYSRYLEPMAILLIKLAYQHGFGTGIGFKLVH